jgi:hypothetical protein
MKGKGGPRFGGSCGWPCINMSASLQQAKNLLVQHRIEAGCMVFGWKFSS